MSDQHENPHKNYDRVFKPKAKRVTSKAPGTRAVGSRDNPKMRENSPAARSGKDTTPHEYAGRQHTQIKKGSWPGAAAPSKTVRGGAKEPHH